MTNVSPHGFWLLVGGEELFLPFADFPWFKNATIGALVNVVVEGQGHLHWPELDIDLSIDSIAHPKRYPLVSRVADRGASMKACRASSHGVNSDPERDADRS